jgi:hypothetical protein
MNLSQGVDFRHDVAIQFQRNATHSRAAVFGHLDAKYHPISLVEDARQMTPGFVGRAYRPGGLVFMGINPGGGGDAYKVRTSEDEVFYRALGQFTSADSANLDTAFDRLTEVFQQVVQRWNLWRIFSAALEAAGSSLGDVAYLNAVPYRTRQDTTPPASAKDRAWYLITGPTLSLLKPSLIVSLGRKTGVVLDQKAKRGALDPTVVTLTIERSIGDRRITPKAQSQLQELRASWAAETCHARPRT